MSEVNWDEVERFERIYDAADPWLREAFDQQISRWNALLYQLADLIGEGYNGETSNELVEILRDRLSDSYLDGRYEGYLEGYDEGYSNGRSDVEEEIRIYEVD